MSGSDAGKDERVGVFQLALLVFTLVVLCALVADTVSSLPKELSNLIHIVDTFACGVFFVDFSIRFYKAESKLAFMRWGWVDLIACIPNLEILRFGRMVRILRIIRLLRGVRSVQLVLRAVLANRAESGAAAVILSAILLVAFSSASVLVCERHADGNIKTAEDAVWWSVSTLTTVGSGDKYPVTAEGRVLGMVLMVAGVGLFGGLSGLAASFFLEKRGRDPDTREILDRLESLQGTVNTLKEEKTLTRGERDGKGLAPESKSSGTRAQE